ncbi:succinate dehydrogenase [Seleniivibrio woodruffii]|jgi:succinate dehydrogenase / fumarate reductase cytochrome b subunit|uniref:succinate dehydrogenase, cytochrome b556 subunit n=1 Tax=Seleniivibrio woodruffii TaxID=1078050 RepID=UPI0026EACF9B|nr:succinate dehydrogenase [Seleniivibrio woodruffii]
MPRKDLENYPKKTGYRKHPGMVAWLLHRGTGVIIGLYLILHILGVSGTVAPFLEVTKLSVVKALFLASFSFHAFNGVRIVLMEFGAAAERESFKKYFMAVVFLTLIITVIGIIPIFAA